MKKLSRQDWQEIATQYKKMALRKRVEAKASEQFARRIGIMPTEKQLSISNTNRSKLTPGNIKAIETQWRESQQAEVIAKYFENRANKIMGKGPKP